MNQDYVILQLNVCGLVQMELISQNFGSYCSDLHFYCFDVGVFDWKLKSGAYGLMRDM